MVCEMSRADGLGRRGKAAGNREASVRTWVGTRGAGAVHGQVCHSRRRQHSRYTSHSGTHKRARFRTQARSQKPAPAPFAAACRAASRWPAPLPSMPRVPAAHRPPQPGCCLQHPRRPRPRAAARGPCRGRVELGICGAARQATHWPAALRSQPSPALLTCRAWRRAPVPPCTPCPGAAPHPPPPGTPPSCR